MELKYITPGAIFFLAAAGLLLLWMLYRYRHISITDFLETVSSSFKTELQTLPSFKFKTFSFSKISLKSSEKLRKNNKPETSEIRERICTMFNSNPENPQSTLNEVKKQFSAWTGYITEGNTLVSINTNYRELGNIKLTKEGDQWKPIKKE